MTSRACSPSAIVVGSGSSVASVAAEATEASVSAVATIATVVASIVVVAVATISISSSRTEASVERALIPGLLLILGRRGWRHRCRCCSLSNDAAADNDILHFSHIISSFGGHLDGFADNGVLATKVLQEFGLVEHVRAG